MPLVVQKYGGTSVGSLAHIQNVAKHVTATARSGARVIVAISAMGEQTDELLGMAQALNPRPPRRELDMLLTAGERISAALLAIALDAQEIPSVSLTGSQCGILTDETHGNARITQILGDRVRAGLASGRVVIVAGFQGVSPRTKEITTLGRGGTDLSAIALAAALNADSCELYKDVRGVYTADPRVVPEARVRKRLSWEAMTALAWSGASVLHPRGAHLAAKFGIPFEIRSSMELETTGTRIDGGEERVESPKIEAIAHKKNMALVETRAAGPFAIQLLPLTHNWLWEQGEAPLVSSQTSDGKGHYTLTQLLPEALVADYTEMLRHAALAQGKDLEIQKRVDGLATISVIGAGFQQSPETVAKALDALGTAPIVVEARNNALNFAVAEADLTSALAGLHRALIGTDPE